VLWLLLRILWFIVQNNLKSKKHKTDSESKKTTKLQQADAAVNYRETRCISVGTLRVIQSVT
jgi:hypothetical protein